MSATIARAREVLAEPGPWWDMKAGIVGLLAVAIVAGDGTEAEIAEARGIVLAFYEELRWSR